ncbi:MAG: ABC transporter substrate-binding protein [Oscillospiraceae bacterium]|jgi:iron complex transport system substrate-binding protein|nr:ABC transporter substrate-binding protein [Oscillospiraceae bacterium]
MKKQIFAVLAAVIMLASALTSCGTPRPDANSRVFTDSAGREVLIPKDVTRVAPSGAVATMFLSTIAPEYMVSVASTPSSAQYKYMPKELMTLPTTGQMYGSKSTINLEALLDAEPQLIIDLGDKKDGIAKDMDRLQKQTGIPVVFIEADLDDMAAAYRSLGAILSDKAVRGEEIAVLIDETVTMATENSAKIPEAERISVMYTSGTTGLATNAQGSTQAQVLPLIGAKNAIVVDEVSDRGGGNIISMEQLYNFDPEVIIFATGSVYDTAGSERIWQELSAVKNGRYYEIPGMPYNWMSSPPSINMILGIWWLGNLLYPEVYSYNIAEKATECFRVFWQYELSAEEAAEMLANSSLK